MNVISVSLVFYLINHCQSAAIHQKNDTLETFKNDISNVGSAIENFTFDIIRSILEDTDEEDTTVATRKKRSVEETLELCQRKCQEQHEKIQTVETQRINELKGEVKRLQELVQLLQQQQKIMNILDEETATKKETREKTEEQGNIPNSEQLALIRLDLKEAIESLNQTKEFLLNQKEKSDILEQELMEQQEEIKKLKLMVDSMLEKNETVSARSSEFSQIRKLLKNLPEDDESDEEDLKTKIEQLHKLLRQKKQQENLVRELKELEKSLSEDERSKDLLEQMIKAIKSTKPQSKTNGDISNLDELKEAIDNLRPKENDNNEAAQFQAVINKLISSSKTSTPSTFSSSRPAGQITITPEQMFDLTKKLNPNNNPYICISDEGGKRAPPVNSRNFQFYAPAPVDYSNQKAQFFPAQFTQPNYYPPASINGVGPEKSFNYQSPNTDINQWWHKEETKNQIAGLQAAIDSLNRPEYIQNPEDKAIIENLQRQITDLRGVVDNLNYGNYHGNRTKRSLDDNKLDDSAELMKEVRNIVGRILETDQTIPNGPPFEEIQKKIDLLKNQLGSDNKERAAYPQSYDFPEFSKGLMNSPLFGAKTSLKNDFFSDLVSKILDKIISVIPTVVQKLFGFSLEELSKNDYSDYDVQVLFKNLGVFAYLPVILLRLVKGIASFLSILKKNNFFKTFLMPAIILGTVTGAVLFLTWWLQPEDNYNSPYQSNYGTTDSNNNYYYDQNSKYPVTPNYPAYSRSYYSQ